MYTRCLASALAISLTIPVQAQKCEPHWLPGEGIPGIIGEVFATVLWDADEDGPNGPLLVVGGEYNRAGTLVTTNIALWNGESWQPLGNGINTPVLSLGVHKGDLIVGTVSGDGGALLRWDGASWQSFGLSGITNAIAEYNGELIVAGGFGSKNRLLRWDGQSWQTVGDANLNNEVYALHVFDGDLMVGGAFNASGFPKRLARWNGSTWSEMGSTNNLSVRAMCTHNGELVLGCDNQILQWTGSSWASLPVSVHVRTMVAFNNELFVGGESGVHLAKIVGNSWVLVGGGISGDVLTLVEFDGKLIAGGQFTRVESNTPSETLDALRIASWDGKSWHPFPGGFGSGLRAICVHNSDLVVGGTFVSEGETTLNRVARWNGTSWEPFAVGASGDVNAVIAYGGDLIIGGIFLTAGNTTVNRIARWDGNQWLSLGGVSGGGSTAVHAFTIYEGDLVVGGEFTNAGGVSARRVARWNGATWQPFGAGLGTVRALTVYNGDLIAAGNFVTDVNGTVFNRIARWNGQSWEKLDNGVSGNFGAHIKALCVYGNELIAGGNFTSASGTPANNIARWNGNLWQPLGEGVTGGDPSFVGVYGLAVHDGDLIVLGEFIMAGATTANNIARWDGTSWHPMDLGVNARANAGLSWNEELIVGGGFTEVNGAPSAFIARLVCETPIPGDINGDQIVNVVDLLAVINSWGACADPNACPADVAPPGPPQGDDVVNVLDLLFVINNWG